MPQELRKSKIVACKQQANVVAERLVLDAVRHPFIPRLYRTFRTERKLYMLLELVQARSIVPRRGTGSPATHAKPPHAGI